MLTRTCHQCGVDFPTTRGHAKWCSDRCRKRAAANGGPEVGPRERTPGAVYARVLDELQRLDALDTVDGRSALVLSLYMDDVETSASGLVACSRELREALARLRAVHDEQSRTSIFAGLHVAGRHNHTVYPRRTT